MLPSITLKLTLSKIDKNTMSSWNWKIRDKEENFQYRKKCREERTERLKEHYEQLALESSERQNQYNRIEDLKEEYENKKR